jgi:YD repeat-containing protein
MFLWSAQLYTEADLILPDGARVHYERISSGTGFTDAVFEHTASPTRFYKSRMVWNGTGWDLTLKDGTLYVFGDGRPLQWMRDRHGNTIHFTWSTISFGQGTGNLLKLTSTNGRYIEFTYDTSNRITQATDHIGRTVGYTYDGSGRLWKVTDVAGGVTEYTYGTADRMLTITDPRGILFLTNQYDSNGRVVEQTLADSSTYEFAYTLDGYGKVAQVDVTDPRGHVTRTAFNAGRYPVSVTEAYGTALARTTTITRQSGTHLVTSVTDPLNRQTDFTYDSHGNPTSITRLAGTVDAVTTTMTYEPQFHQVASITDALSHTTTFSYDSRGQLTGVTDR